tara:strand:+ start:205 stop:528 length:324 start_codon:yes stop_codon:yes gene_type:complete
LFLSSCFSKIFFFLLNHLRFRSELLLSSGRRILQRSKPLSTTSFLPLSIHSTESPTRLNHHPVDRRAFYTPDPVLQPSFKLNLLINKKFSKSFIAEVARILQHQNAL